jgi:O-acetyl-ADP-ribose deacetylase (regulator of RNase III)
VIHTVGPVWEGGHAKEAELLACAYRSSLQLAADHGLSVVAFPNISTGVYGYPKAAAARVALSTCADFLRASALPKTIIFVCFDEENTRLYSDLMEANAHFRL